MKLIPITEKDRLYQNAKRLYCSAFPREERVPWGWMYRKSKHASIDFLSVTDQDIPVGFIYLIHGNQLTYVFYFAMEESRRGKGYGSRTLAMVKERYPDHRIFLAIEELDERADNYAQRVGRLAFYQKNGFERTSCKLRERSVIYDVLSTDGGDISNRDYLSMMHPFLTGPMRLFFKTYIIPPNDGAK
ncbi:MAG: GNAT family N-acetyltransferase [Clostridia bacterium]|nr:GNAT family N-acetyltransferase [Clostridia bacterium]